MPFFANAVAAGLNASLCLNSLAAGKPAWAAAHLALFAFGCCACRYLYKDNR